MSNLTFLILSLEGAILSFNVAATAALVPSIAADFGVSQFLAGKVIWLYMLPYGAAALLYGPLVRRIDAKKVELFCMLFFSLANLLATLSTRVYALFLGRFLMGAFGASVIPLGIILIARHVEAGKRGKYVGNFFAITFVASLAGLILSGLIHWRYIYLIPAISGLILCIPMIIFLPSFKPNAALLKISYLDSFRNKKILYLFTYIFIISLLYHGAQQWLGVYFSTKYGFSQFVISSLITLTSLSGIFGEVLGGHFADSFGRVRTINLGIAFMIVSIFTLQARLPFLMLAVLMVAWGLGWTLNHAGMSTILTDLPDKFLNEAASLNSSVRFVAGGAGVALAGVLMQKSFVIGYGAFGACLLILLAFSRKLLVNNSI